MSGPQSHVRKVDVEDEPERQGGWAYIGFFLGSTPGFGVGGGGVGDFGEGGLSGIGIQHLS